MSLLVAFLSSFKVTLPNDVAGSTKEHYMAHGEQFQRCFVLFLFCLAPHAALRGALVVPRGCLFLSLCVCLLPRPCFGAVMM